MTTRDAIEELDILTNQYKDGLNPIIDNYTIETVGYVKEELTRNYQDINQLAREVRRLQYKINDIIDIINDTATESEKLIMIMGVLND